MNPRLAADQYYLQIILLIIYNNELDIGRKDGKLDERLLQ
jgi:hypothetical protein